MASFTKQFSFCLILLIISSSQIQARESKFFSKITHVTVKPGKGVEESKPAHVDIPVPPLEHIALAPTLEPTSAPAPPPAYTETEYGNGLYVPSEDEMLTPTKEQPATKTTTTNKENYENEVLSEGFSGESLQTRYPNSNYNNDVYSNNYKYNGNTNTKENNVYTNLYSGNGYSSKYNENWETKNDNTNVYTNNYENNMYTATYSTNDNNDNYKNEISNNYNNNGYTTNFNTNGYQTGRQGMSDTRFLENGKYYYELNNNGYASNHNTNGYQTKQRGMSDTRFLENGKYYYDVNNERANINAYEPEKTTTTDEALNENNSNPYEFNTMGEYYRSQGYQETP